MLSAELRINGCLIAHIYGHNEGYIDQDSDVCSYFYSYHEIKSQNVIEGHIQHSRMEGLSVLVERILEVVNLQKRNIN